MTKYKQFNFFRLGFGRRRRPHLPRRLRRHHRQNRALHGFRSSPSTYQRKSSSRKVTRRQRRVQDKIRCIFTARSGKRRTQFTNMSETQNVHSKEKHKFDFRHPEERNVDEDVGNPQECREYYKKHDPTSRSYGHRNAKEARLQR